MSGCYFMLVDALKDECGLCYRRILWLAKEWEFAN